MSISLVILVVILAGSILLGAVSSFITWISKLCNESTSGWTKNISDEEIESLLQHFVETKVGLSNNRHGLDNLTVAFLRLMLPEEYRPREHEYLSSWDRRPNTPEKITAIRNRAYSSISAKLKELREQDSLRREAEVQRLRADMEQKAQNLLSRNADKVNKFLEITYRKVATPDDYGDENPAALDAEIWRVVQKLGEGEADLAQTARYFKDNKSARATLALRNPLVRAVVQELANLFVAYYKQRKDGDPVIDVGKMTGLDFELHIVNLLRNAGISDVSTTPITGDQGGDLLFTSNGKRYVIQAKRYTGTVGNKAVQEAYAAKGFYRCDCALVVTNSQFTPAARNLAKELGVLLVNGNHLAVLSHFIDVINEGA